MGPGVCVWRYWWLWWVRVGCGATRRRWCGFPARSALFWLFVAMRRIATKSLLIWQRACWSEGCFFGQKAPSAIRCIKTPDCTVSEEEVDEGQKAPSAIRCIKTCPTTSRTTSLRSGQKAPSAIRCIKTAWLLTLLDQENAKRQKAPSAIRCIKTFTQLLQLVPVNTVRKHRAP